MRTHWKGKPALLVLDAKDYDYESWPGSADIAKQMLYRLLVSDKLRDEGMDLPCIGNAFLFPSREQGADPVAVVGRHELRQEAVGRMGRIVGLEVDYETVAKAYLAGRSDEDLVRATRLAAMPWFEASA